MNLSRSPQRLVLLGPPASGKGTQARALVSRLGVPHLSTGDMLRAARQAGSPVGRRAAVFMSAGNLVPDEVVVELVAERLGTCGAAEGFILDGFPRTIPQAVSLDALLASCEAPLDRVLQLDVDRELLIERAVLRRTDVSTGQIYHLKYNPPPAGATLEHRDDDHEDQVKVRLDAYDRMTAALLPYYEAHGLLTRVDAVGAPDEITQRIKQALGQ